MKKYDLIIVGAGPAGIFLCTELKRLNSKIDILLIEQGKKVEERNCPNANGKKCIKCKPFCQITSGFSGAGAFSDGKLSLYNKQDDEIHVGGNLSKYLGVKNTKKIIDYTDSIYLDYGADKKLKGDGFYQEIEEYKRKAKENGLNLISIPIRHLGTEKAHQLYYNMEQDLFKMENLEILFETKVIDMLIKNNKISGVVVEDNKTKEKQKIYSPNVVVAVGRKGANWLFQMCNKHNIKSKSGVVDVGIRYELSDTVMQDINKIMYEAKFTGRLLPYEDKVRTFCQNPSGFVSSEVYDNDLTLVNGHSYKYKKSQNTNLAILCSHRFSYPFDQPILYGRNIAKNSNMLGAGEILVQRLGDILTGHRSHEKDLKNNDIQPTLKSAVAGDITYALGYRTMTNILQFIKAIDKVIPGFANSDNLLYSPEIKFYSNEVIIDKYMQTSVEGLYSIGDAGGLTRGLMQASCSGVYLAKVLNKKKYTKAYI